MPELPDVERFRRFVERHAGGRRVERVVVTDAGILRNASARTLDRSLRGHRFQDPDRHGKWLIAWTTGPAVLLHFGMTGDLSWAEGPGERHRHDRVIFVTDRGELRFRDMRKLGGVWLAHGPQEVTALLEPIGPDALDLSRRGFLARLARRRGRVKAVLMDQRLLAGVGNLLADEALWHARIHPARRIEGLPDTDRDRLYTELRSVLRQAIEHQDYVPAKRRWLTHVRGQPGARCPRCRTALERTTIAGRTTWFCPACQSAVD